jgi:hypothetical protein
VIRYEVVVETAPELAERFAEYMRAKHIPEILATGCFVEIRLQRADGDRFRTSYLADGRPALDRYLAEHTERFRADFRAHFPEGVNAVREIWTDLEAWKR